MADLEHDVHILVSIARIDATLRDHKVELEKIPTRLAAVDKAVARLENDEKSAVEAFETMQKERRTLEKKLQDHEAQIVKYKNQQMEVKNNKEYQAILKEIANLEQEIDSGEERLLELMDELDTKAGERDERLGRLAAEKKENLEKRASLEERKAFLESELGKLEAEKPRLLKDVEPGLLKQYNRLQKALGGLAVTTVENENCGGCGTRLPPQQVHEIKRNDHIVRCEACGRILVYYAN